MLSAATTPSLPPVSSDPTLKAPTPQKPPTTAEPKEPPRWPISPRLRSPPPVGKPSVVSPRKAEPNASMSALRSPPPTDQPDGRQAASDVEGEEATPVSGTRSPARGFSGTNSTLETVQEISLPNTPARGLSRVPENGENGVSKSESEHETVDDSASNKTIKARTSNESGSDSGGKSEGKGKTSAPTRPSGPSKAYTTSAMGRGKPSGEGSVRNMTVETETVSSIPQVAVGTGPGGPGNNGSLRAKPSAETIRPKKEKKKSTRKAPSLTSGTASSKADIFEAKVASAVDEANSSDSEETFVYESNPPDTSDRPRRFHSRTPSATSMGSQVDQRNGVRSAIDGAHSVTMKKSMKFANSYNSNPPEIPVGEDDGSGTIRSGMGTGRGTAHHHHIGRWGRNGGNGHASLFDNESPFPNAAKSKLGPASTPKHSPRQTSPRLPNGRTAFNGKKSAMSYDLDDGADDERTPLISTIRSGRSGRRRQAPSARQLEHQASRQPRPFLTWFAGCLVLSLMIILVISAFLGFMFATTQPLTDVKIVALKDILASEQDVIFDVKVAAKNPNVASVTIDTTDLVIFAKSQYAGTDAEWWTRPQAPKVLRRVTRRDNDLSDSPDGPGNNPNLEIGHVFHLYSPLVFDGSPFKHGRSESTGQIRISHPGNHTIPAGSKRWGNVLQHEFDLIVRGTLKYTLPLSHRVRSISVEGRAAVKPNSADDDPDTVRIN